MRSGLALAFSASSASTASASASNSASTSPSSSSTAACLPVFVTSLALPGLRPRVVGAAVFAGCAALADGGALAAALVALVGANGRGVVAAFFRWPSVARVGLPVAAALADFDGALFLAVMRILWWVSDTRGRERCEIQVRRLGSGACKLA
jgi:hypothetical protein